MVTGPAGWSRADLLVDGGRIGDAGAPRTPLASPGESCFRLFISEGVGLVTHPERPGGSGSW
jgi:hypothetical protein